MSAFVLEKGGDSMEIWVVEFSDNDELYRGTSALFSNEEDARKCFEEEKKNIKVDYADQVVYWEEADGVIEGYSDEFANDTVCSLELCKRPVDGSWRETY